MALPDPEALTQPPITRQQVMMEVIRGVVEKGSAERFLNNFTDKIEGGSKRKMAKASGRLDRLLASREVLDIGESLYSTKARATTQAEFFADFDLAIQLAAGRVDEEADDFDPQKLEELRKNYHKANKRLHEGTLLIALGKHSNLLEVATSVMEDPGSAVIDLDSSRESRQAHGELANYLLPVYMEMRLMGYSPFDLQQ